MKFETGQLVESTMGNLGIIIEVDGRHCSVMWCSTGCVRTGFPCMSLRRVR
jgi:hypothetical protein